MSGPLEVGILGPRHWEPLPPTFQSPSVRSLVTASSVDTLRVVGHPEGFSRTRLGTFLVTRWEYVYGIAGVTSGWSESVLLGLYNYCSDQVSCLRGKKKNGV